MAKISELPRLDTPLGDELVPVVDATGVTQGIAVGDLVEGTVRAKTERDSSRLDALAPILPATVTPLGGEVAANATLGAGVAVEFAEVPASGLLTKVRVPITAPGKLNLVLIDPTDAPNRFRFASRYALAVAKANAVNVIDLQVPVRIGQRLILESPADRGATMPFAEGGAGRTTYALFGAVPDGVSDWNVYGDRQFPGAADLSSFAMEITPAALEPDFATSIATSSVISTEMDTAFGQPLMLGSDVAFDQTIGIAAAVTIGRATRRTWIRAVEITVDTPGSFTLLRLRQDGTSFTTTRLRDVAAPNAGAKNVIPLAGGTPVILEPGEWLALQQNADGGTLRWRDNADVANWFVFGIAAGTQVWNPTNRAYGVIAHATYYDFSALGETEVGADDLTPALGRALSRPALTFATAFGNQAPDGWTFGGAWTHAAGGALSPEGAGDMSVFARVTQPSLLHDEQRSHRLWFTPQTAGVRFGFGLTRASHGTLLVVDGAAGTMAFSRANSGGSGGDADTSWTAPPQLLASVPIALLANRRYLLTLRKDRRMNVATLHDARTRALVATLTNGSNADVVIPVGGYQFGSPIVVPMAGPTLFERLAVTSSRLTPRVMVIGDSLSEAPYDGGVLLRERWVQRLSDAVGGNITVAAISGSRSTEIASLLACEIPAIKPQIIIAAYGTNDEDGALATFRAQYDALVAYCAEHGILLAVVRLPPSNRQTGQINAYLDSLPQTVRRIGWDLALTTGHDGVTRNMSLDAGDGVHFNGDGQGEAADQVMFDVPEVLDCFV